MKCKVRTYNSSELGMISNWYEDIKPLPDMLLEDGTFILELDDVPALCLTVLLTQSKCMSYIFNYIKNPVFKEVSLEDYGYLLWDHCFDYAKNKGYSQIICLAPHEKLRDKYKRFGMSETLQNLTSMIRIL